jgi:hypothetical protein
MIYNNEEAPDIFSSPPEREYSREKEIEVINNENFPEINLNNKDVLEIKKKIDDILGKKWDLSNENVQVGLFTGRKELEEFAQENEIPLEDLSEDSALFYIDPSTQEKYVFIVNPARIKEMLKDMGYPEEEAIDFSRRNLLAGVAHEMTHMHPFFEKHGNRGRKNLWEQEMICNYIESTTKGDISELLIRLGYVDKEKIEKFTLENGEWNSFSRKNAVIDYFYPFLVKEYGLDNTRKIWKGLQINSEISVVIREILGVDAEEVVTNFKQKTIELIEKY